MTQKGFAMKLKMVQEIFVALLLPTIACAQTQGSPPVKPPSNPAGLGAFNFSYRAGLTCGAGASESSAAVNSTVQCGASLTFLPFLNLETGVMGPQANRSPVSGYLSTDLMFPLMPPSKVKRDLPLFTGGYTRMFETGNALDYGIGFAHSIDSSHSIQFEVRDYWVNANPDQHNIVFRVVWLVGLTD
jgi:hypothetical protein